MIGDLSNGRTAQIVSYYPLPEGAFRLLFTDRLGPVTVHRSYPDPREPTDSFSLKGSMPFPWALR